MAKKTGRRPPKFVHRAAYGVAIEPAVIGGPGASAAVRIPLLRRVVHAFEVYPAAPGADYWQVGVLNENQAAEWMQEYIVEIPAKSKLPPWTAEELAIEAARRLNEYRGCVALQRFKDGICEFAAAFASNSLWTFCLWSTDPAACPPKKPWPDGWRPGEPFPAHLPRREIKEYPPADCHHPDPNPAKFSKLARKALP